MINTPQIYHHVVFRTLGGAHTVCLRADQIEQYRSDPDLFAARYFGLSKEDYFEWIRLDGIALCSERTRTGQPCSLSVGGGQHNPRDWKELHRSVPCTIHSGRNVR